MSKNAFNKYKRRKTPEDKIELNRLRATARLTTRPSLTEYVSLINISTHMNELWMKYGRISGRDCQYKVHCHQLG